MQRERFIAPDLNAPLDVNLYRGAAPHNSAVKGVLFQDLTTQLTQAGISPPKKYINFRDYPLSEYFELLLETASRVYPKEPLRRALCLVGRGAYPTFAASLIGKVLYGAIGKNPESILKLAPRGYSLVQNHAKVHWIESSPSHTLLSFRGVPTFLDSLHVGVIEGAVISCERSPRVSVSLEDLFSGQMLVEY